MSENFDEIRLLLQKKAEYLARLNLMPYDGTFCTFSINYNLLVVELVETKNFSRTT